MPSTDNTITPRECLFFLFRFHACDRLALTFVTKSIAMEATPLLPLLQFALFPSDQPLFRIMYACIRAKRYARVVQLHDGLSELNQKALTADEQIFTFQDDIVEFSDVLVKTPADQVLVENLSFQLRKGGSLLITGHNGAGKSSIFR